MDLYCVNQTPELQLDPENFCARLHSLTSPPDAMRVVPTLSPPSSWCSASSQTLMTIHSNPIISLLPQPMCLDNRHGCQDPPPAIQSGKVNEELRLGNQSLLGNVTLKGVTLETPRQAGWLVSNDIRLLWRCLRVGWSTQPVIYRVVVGSTGY